MSAVANLFSYVTFALSHVIVLRWQFPGQFVLSVFFRFSFLPFRVPASHCLIHEGCVVELQVLVQQPDRDEYQ